MIKRIRVWKEVIIGGIAKERLFQEYLKRGIDLDNDARAIIEAQDFKNTPQYRVKIGKNSLNELGVDEWLTWNDILDFLAAEGINKCTSEIAAHVRLHDLEQESGTICWYLMDALIDSEGYSIVLCNLRGGSSFGGLLGGAKPRLSAFCKPPHELCYPGTEVIYLVESTQLI